LHSDRLSGQALLISGNNPGSGGLFVLDAEGVRKIDHLATHGLALQGGLLYRVVSDQSSATLSGDLLTYDSSGVVRYDRLDGVISPHDVMPQADRVLISSSINNAVHQILSDGSKGILWQANVPADSWHLNCLTEFDGELYATAFGKFNQFRAWSQDRLAPTGLLFHIPSGETILSSLTQPHTPRRLDGAWIVCNSALNELAMYDDRGAKLQSVQLAGYTRGLAYDENYIYVGESGSRHVNNGVTKASRVTIFHRSDWSVAASYEIDTSEIYDLLLVPTAVVQGAMTGFRTKASRARHDNQLAMFAGLGVSPVRLWAIGEPLPVSSLRAHVEAVLPSRILVDETIKVPCRVTNKGNAIYVSAPPNPIQFCYRWFDDGGSAIGAGQWIHTDLPRPLPPGESLDVAVMIAAPHLPGTFTLAVTLLQEDVAWFDDVSLENGVRGAVVVHHLERTPVHPTTASAIFIGHDFYGAGNFGDDLMLQGFLLRFAQAGRRERLVIATAYDIESQRRRFPEFEWISSVDYPARETALAESLVWLGLGATAFQMSSGPWMLDHVDRQRELCDRLNKPMIFLGVGCESLESVHDPKALRTIQAAQKIWTRDAESAHAIRRVAAPGVVTEGADLAHIAMASATKQAVQSEMLGLLLGLDGPGVVATSAVEMYLARRTPATTRWLVQEGRSFPCTELWNYAALSETAKSVLDVMPLDYSADSIERFLTNFGAPEAVLSSRYHGSLVAAWHGCRVGVIARSGKLSALAADLDLPSVAHIRDPEDLQALERNARPVESARLQSLRKRAETMCDQFFAWLDALN
jgi:uncharacterized protein (TIGR03032 family)